MSNTATTLRTIGDDDGSEIQESDQSRDESSALDSQVIKGPITPETHGHLLEEEDVNRISNSTGRAANKAIESKSDSGEYVFDLVESSPPKKIDMPTPPEVQPHPIVLGVSDYLNGRCAQEHGVEFSVSTPPLLDNTGVLSSHRRKITRRVLEIRDLEAKYDYVTSRTDAREYYDSVFDFGLYDSYGLLIENIARLLYADKYLEEIKDEKKSAFLIALLMLISKRKRLPDGTLRLATKLEDGNDFRGIFMELAAGTANIAGRIQKSKDHCRLHLQLEQDKVERPHNTRLKKQAYRDADQIGAQIEGWSDDFTSTYVPRIRALDNYDNFGNVAAMKQICGIHSDLCAPTSDFFRQSRHMPNSVDTMTFILAADRMLDLDQALINMRHLAKMDGSSQVLLGFYLPMSNRTDSVSKTEGIRNVEFFDASSTSNDMRKRWMQGFDGELAVDESFFAGIEDPFQRREAAQLADMLMMLKRRHGISARSLGSQQFEVSSPHNIIEKVRTIRERYTREELQTGNRELDRLIEKIFTENSPLDDDKTIVIPEHFPRLYTVACDFDAPMDGSRFLRVA